jgi:hypothetical protein
MTVGRRAVWAIIRGHDLRTWVTKCIVCMVVALEFGVPGVEPQSNRRLFSDIKRDGWMASGIDRVIGSVVFSLSVIVAVNEPRGKGIQSASSSL